MNDTKFLKKLNKKILARIDKAYEQGYDDGILMSEDTPSYEDGFNAGATAERDRIKAIFDMNIKWALESNKGSDVVFFTKAKEIIEPIEVDYSEEAYQRSLEQDGF